MSKLVTSEFAASSRASRVPRTIINMTLSAIRPFGLGRFGELNDDCMNEGKRERESNTDFLLA